MRIVKTEKPRISFPIIHRVLTYETKKIQGLNNKNRKKNIFISFHYSKTLLKNLIRL